jgi:hypothetical protein
MDRHAEAATMVIERRKLWSTDGKQLYQIALEFSTIGAEMSENQEDTTESLSREKVFDEAIITLQQAKAAGYAIQTHELPVVLRARYELSNKYAGEVQP